MGFAASEFTRDKVGFLSVEGQLVESLDEQVDVGDERQWLAWLTAEATRRQDGREQLATALIAHCRDKGIQAPAHDQARGVAAHALQDFERLLCHRVVDQLGDAAGQLEELLPEPGTGSGWLLAELRSEVTPIDLRSLARELDDIMSLQALGLPTDLAADSADRVWLRSLLTEVEKLTALRRLCLPADLLTGFPAELVAAWSARAADAQPEQLQALPQPVRVTLLSALCAVRRAEITDLLGHALIGLLHQIRARAEHRLGGAADDVPLPGTTRDVLLFDLVKAAVENPDDTVRAALYPIAGEPLLKQLMRDSAARAAEHARRKRAVLRGTYSACHQQLLRLLLASLEFRSREPGCWPLLAALGELVGEYTACWGRGRFYEAGHCAQLEDVVPPEWQSAVVDREGRVERIAYEFCVLVSLRDQLCTRQIYLAHGHRWGEPPPVPARARHAEVRWPAQDE
ncbi:hypothetical protein SAMN05421805_11178 [Saccharopolyspora antimicrobica]|uniref:DUF4158 domain-containing protein n=1 Tax=Saccharopolyspora antimicrobica TaxID=455193 RepID=A0A1I5FJ22_9PSEU|nr:hypothetical protein [Saccharopolyspora antimicrobica]RKT82163.1 hypothetical protein ATL45_0406 [Saccharopolyspora antimicrobica]SFO23311.1 hypothetical protein SAMN05421805_11178 [Saccharopolyspora antimicrobica]